MVGGGRPACESLSIVETGQGLLLGVRVAPSSRRTAVQGVYGDRIKVSISAPPEDNRANKELLRALAVWLDVGKDRLWVASGHASRDKVIGVSGITEPELRKRLECCLNSHEAGKGETVGL